MAVMLKTEKQILKGILMTGNIRIVADKKLQAYKESVY
jgi:hypothetical protein